jgi:hypothetical protein
MGGLFSAASNKVPSRLDESFCEKLAIDLLERDGSDIVARLRLEAIAARGDGHRRGAELLVQIADAAERLLGQTDNQTEAASGAKARSRVPGKSRAWTVGSRRDRRRLETPP